MQGYTRQGNSCEVLRAPLSRVSFQPVLHDWYNKDRGMCYPVCGMVHIKEPLLLNGKSSPCGGSGFPLSLFEWSFTICLTPYIRKYNVLSVSAMGRRVNPAYVDPLSCFSFQPVLHYWYVLSYMWDSAYKRYCC